MVKIKDRVELCITIQDILLEKTNCGLISLGIHRVCRNFMDEIEKLALSEELQDYE